VSLIRVVLACASILASSGIGASPPVEPVVRVRQLAEASRAITGEDRLVVPLLVSVDAAGRVAGFATDGEPSTLARLSRFDHPERGRRLSDILKEAGIDAANIGVPSEPALVVFSIPGACPPCDALQDRLAGFHALHPGLRVVVYTADVSPMAPR